MKIAWIRHGQTPGNREQRYIGGRWDEGLSAEGIAELHKKQREGCYPTGTRLIVSPMKRCRETAEILYPDLQPRIWEDFRECDFGSFEGKSARELLEISPYYQRWIDSGGTLPFPEGESMELFVERCRNAFVSLLKELGAAADTDETLLCIVHGGTIMGILSSYPDPGEQKVREYYSLQTQNGCGFLTELLTWTASETGEKRLGLRILDQIGKTIRKGVEE